MVSIDPHMRKGQRAKSNRATSIMCLFVALLVISVYSKPHRDLTKSASPAQLFVINESLKDYRFIREDFDDPDRVWSFLQRLVGLYYQVPHLLIGSSVTLWQMERDGDLSTWLGGKEKSEAVLRELCQDPKFVFEGNKWKVIFNVFKPDGSVDKSEVVGE